jgi:hypothetical protein
MRKTFLFASIFLIVSLLLSCKENTDISVDNETYNINDDDGETSKDKDLDPALDFDHEEDDTKDNNTDNDNDLLDNEDYEDDIDLPDDIFSEKELTIEQIYFPGVAMGESTIIIGPDGTSVLIDTGGSNHSEFIVDAILRHTGVKEIDWVIITHYHHDHLGAFDSLFGSKSEEKIQINKGVVQRGFFDLSKESASNKNFSQYCNLIQEEFSHLTINLCSGIPMICGEENNEPWKADDCSGLTVGNIENDADNHDGIATYIPLGYGASLYFTHANGWVATTSGHVSAEQNDIPIGWGGTDEENARSLGGVIKWGNFKYVFAGDTQGRDIKMEAFIALHGDKIKTDENKQLITTTGADVIKLSHHGLASSTSQEWVDWLMPDDNKTRNAIIGNTDGYVTSPALSVVNRVSPRLGNGFIWLSKKAVTAPSNPKLMVTDSAITVKVKNGDNYVVITGHYPDIAFSETYLSIED